MKTTVGNDGFQRRGCGRTAMKIQDEDDVFGLLNDLVQRFGRAPR